MVSIITLWVLVLFETVLLVLLLRALGELRQRGMLAGSGQTQTSTDRGSLALGIQAPAFAATDHEGATVALEDTHGRWRVLAFVSPGCAPCGQAIHALNAFLIEQQDIAVLVIGATDHKENQAYGVERNAAMPILTPQPNLAKEVYLIRGVPFVYILDETGVICAKGTINELEHLHRLLTETKAPTLASSTR